MLFTLIIATYNAELVLPRCLDSISLQSFDDYELVVIDAASSDSTANIITNTSKVTCWISEPDNGIYDAWNKGLAKANGQWIIFLGADDFLSIGALECLAHYCRNNPTTDYVSGKVALVDADANQLRIVGKPWRWSDFRHGMNVAHPCSAHNAKLFNEVGFYSKKYRIVGDYELLLRKGKYLRTGFVNVVLAHMTVGGVSYMNFDALKERYWAKNEHHSVSVLANYLSYKYACLKLVVKKVLLCIGLVKV